MESAEQGEVRETCLPTVCPVTDVMAIDIVLVGTARKATAAVTCPERAANSRRNRPRLAAHIEWFALFALDDRDHTCITAQATRGLNRQGRAILMLAAAGTTLTKRLHI